MRQPKKDAKIEVRLTATEKQMIKEHFASKNINLSEYIREHLLSLSEQDK